MMHTKGPWRFAEIDANDPEWGACEIWDGKNSQPIATMICGAANARRIVACVNALEGFDIVAIEGGVVRELVEALKYARRENVNLAVSGTDRINEVCERLQKTDPSPIWPIPFPDPPERTWQPIVRQIDAALAKIGETQ